MTCKYFVIFTYIKLITETLLLDAVATSKIWMLLNYWDREVKEMLEELLHVTQMGTKLRKIDLLMSELKK